MQEILGAIVPPIVIFGGAMVTTWRISRLAQKRQNVAFAILMLIAAAVLITSFFYHDAACWRDGGTHYYPWGGG